MPEPEYIVMRYVHTESTEVMKNATYQSPCMRFLGHVNKCTGGKHLILLECNKISNTLRVAIIQCLLVVGR